MTGIKIRDTEFRKFSNLMYDLTGINLKPEKKVLVENRLAKRLRYYNLKSYSNYYDLVMENKSELQEMINLLTTNETHFFRQPKHYDFLENEILPNINGKISIWSAASSSGCEAYSAAMILEDYSRKKSFNWQILLSDINEAELNRARFGHYPLKLTKDIKKEFLKAYCLKGTGPEKDNFIIKDELKKNLKFMKINLNDSLPTALKLFDLVFLRNILIYFDNEKKKHLVENVLKKVKPGGYLFIGHSETLNNVTNQVKLIKPTIYQKL